ncbi:MAG TPA: response regulator, partial [Steroidobacteraceae bacterium]|nr:response regulator [Steroidobacteraceae bacterium]
QGSTFALDIPASEPVGEANPAAQPARPSPAPPAGASHHLLLVEDDPGVRNATRMFLRGEGYRVVTAATPEEALARLAEHPDIKVIITDYHLEGGRTGNEVLVAARDRFRSDFPAILVTGDTSSAIADLRRDKHLRVTSKPINADELLALIQELIDG